MVFDSNGDLYVATDRTVEKIDIAGKTHSTFVGSTGSTGNVDGIGTDARFNGLRGIIHINGILYVTDSGNHNIRRIEISTKAVSTFCGSKAGLSGYQEGKGTNSKFNYPAGLESIHDEYIVVTDLNNHVVRKISLTTNETSLLIGVPGMFGMGDGDQQVGPVPKIYAPTQLLFNTKKLFFGTDSNYIYESDCLPKTITSLSISEVREYTAFVNWTKPYDGGFPITHYNIYVTGSSFNRVYNSTSTSLRLTWLPQNTTLSISVRAVNVIGTGPSVNGTEITTKIGCNGVLSTNSSHVCSSHGSCIGPENCTCQTDYAGSDCEYFDCFGISGGDPMVCGGHGKCIGPMNCSCEVGYFSSQCEFTTCNSLLFNDTNVCNSRGNCSIYNNCSCESGYMGSDCEYFECFGLSSNDVSVCSSHGSCDFVNSCNCTGNYTSSDCSVAMCFNVASTSPSVCSYGGNCTAPNVCSCEGGRDGDNCQYHVCFNISGHSSSVCSHGNGSCVGMDNCSCHYGYVGSQCEVPVCYGRNQSDPSSCSGLGNCTMADTCVCIAGRAGNECEFFECYGVSGGNVSVCSNSRGNCTAQDTCVCGTNYFGKECNVTTCFGRYSNISSVCSYHGQCMDFNHCSCDATHVGEACDEYVCHGVSYLNTSVVCYGKGNCSAINTCDCDADYFGQSCNVTTCNGHFSNTTGVCGGVIRGFCPYHDQCACTANYFGDDCEVTQCYGVLSNISSTCSSHGNCTGYNQCLCQKDYYGLNCGITLCFGIFSNATVCSGNGICQPNGNCTCLNGWNGKECDTTHCFGVIHNSSSVCSGNGNCTGLDSCVCDPGWSGSSCHEYGNPIDPPSEPVDFGMIIGATSGGVSLLVLLCLACMACCCYVFCCVGVIVILATFLAPGCIVSVFCPCFASGPGILGMGVCCGRKKGEKIVPKTMVKGEDEDMRDGHDVEASAEGEAGDRSSTYAIEEPQVEDDSSDVIINNNTQDSPVEQLFMNLTDWKIPLQTIVKPPLLKARSNFIYND